MYRHYNIFLAVFIGMLGVLLLVAHHFSAPWAGGDGFSEPVEVVVEHPTGNELFRRGDVISTLPQSPLLERHSTPLPVRFDETIIWMDSGTELRIIESSTKRIEVQVIQGRVVVDGTAQISTRDVKTDINGVASFVHYSWLNEIDVAGIEGSTIVRFEETSLDLSDHATKISTLPPYTQTELEFDPASSSASEFYLEVLR